MPADGTGTTLRCLVVGHLQVDPAWQHAPHAHPFHQLMVVAGGRLAVRADAREVEAGPGDWIFYRAGTPHAERVLGGRGCDFVYVSFTGPVDPAWPLLAADRDGRGRQLAQWLVAEHRGRHPRREAAKDALLAVLVEAFARASEGPEDDFATPLRAWMMERLAEPLDVATLARRAGQSPVAFARRWRRETGRTPIAELRELRLAAARDLLAATSLPLHAIAERCGFCDEQHLSKAFRRAFRRAPGFFRAG